MNKQHAFEKLITTGLSRREAETSLYIGDGFMVKEIGKEMSITTATVKFHLSNVYRKMKLKGKKNLKERVINL
jgi:DNA-binding NarL/FixJ family response regulator